jgi:hypothetical protein
MRDEVAQWTSEEKIDDATQSAADDSASVVLTRGAVVSSTHADHCDLVDSCTSFSLLSTHEVFASNETAIAQTTEGEERLHARVMQHEEIDVAWVYDGPRTHHHATNHCVCTHCKQRNPFNPNANPQCRRIHPSNTLASYVRHMTHTLQHVISASYSIRRVLRSTLHGDANFRPPFSSPYLLA